MTTAQALILLAIAIYLLFMLWIGWICAKKNESVDDFYLGGRKLGPFVTAMSAEASDMSSWLLMGLPGVAYLTGLAEASWTAIGLIVGTYLNWLIVARRIRRYSNRLNAITVPQFFSKRWGGQPLPAVGGGGAGHHHLLYPLHRLRLFRLRQAVFHPVRHGLPHGHADLGGGHRDLHRHGRISGRLLHRSDPVHHHDGGPGWWSWASA